MYQKIISGVTALLLAGSSFPLVQSNAAAPEYSALVINEICSSNKTSFRDESGASPDWIELHNTGKTALDLSGIGLSDSIKNLYKFVFPEGSILEADGYLLVLCDDTSVVSETEYHAAFKLSSAGETLYLTAPAEQDGSSGANLDVVELPELPTDLVYGRYETQFAILSPTPGEVNATDVITYWKLPEFSEAGGFFSEEFDLTISGWENTTLLYTLDGSDPCTSPTAVEYSSPIHIYDNTSEPNLYSAYTNMTTLEKFQSVPDFPVDKGLIVRAVTRDDAGNYSKVISNSYFVGERAPYFSTLKVMSITTDADNFFGDENGIFVNENYNNDGEAWERPCSVQVFEKGQAVWSQDVGIRVSGSGSKAYPQKGMTLYARSKYGTDIMKYDFFGSDAKDSEGGKIEKFKKVTLRNGGDGFDNVRFRDDLNAYLAGGLDISTQTKDDYIVFINGEFWGYYSLQEKLEDNYVESHYDISAKNVTIIKNGECEGNAALADAYGTFLEKACTMDMTKPENYQEFCDTIDVQSFIDYVTVQSYICNWDSLSNVKNYMIWRANSPVEGNSYADGKWRFMLYDTENSAGFAGTGYDSDAILNLDASGKAGSFGTLLYNLLNNPEFRSQFITSYRRIAEENFAPERASAKIDKYLTKLSDAYRDTEKRFVYTSDFESGAETIREFFTRRPEFALKYAEQLVQRYGEMPSQTVSPGDVDGSGDANASDAAAILVESALRGAGEKGKFTSEQNDAADVNHDKTLNATDAAVILVYAAAKGAGLDVEISDFIN